MELFEKYNQVRMPNLDLSSGDVAALIAYIETQSAVRLGVREMGGMSYRRW